MGRTSGSSDKKEGSSGPSKADKKATGRVMRVEKAKKLRLEKKKQKRERQDSRKKLREKLGANAPEKEVPRTIENTREHDCTVVESGDNEVLQEEEHDEMASYFNGETTPKVLITTSPGAKNLTWKFLYEMHKCIPHSEVKNRKDIDLKRIVEQAKQHNFTDIAVIHEDRKNFLNFQYFHVPNALVLIHLPAGPTAYFKINSLRFTDNIKRHGSATSHFPEVILNNFNTRLGHTVARMLAALFPQSPNFKGRRVVTFHNQRDYVFFRHHRYEFKKEGKKAALLELGPRFTLRLKWLQKGTFDTKNGEYEWILKRHEMETSRRRFFL